MGFAFVSLAVLVERLRQSVHIFFRRPSFFVSWSVNKVQAEERKKEVRESKTSKVEPLDNFHSNKRRKPAGRLCSMQNIMPPPSLADCAGCVRFFLFFFLWPPSALLSKWHTAWHELACFLTPRHLQELVEYFLASNTARFLVFLYAAIFVCSTFGAETQLRPALEWTWVKQHFSILRYCVVPSFKNQSRRLRINFIKDMQSAFCLELQLLIIFGIH